MKIEDENEFYLLVFCYIRNKRYLDQYEVEITNNSISCGNHYLSYSLSLQESILIKKLKKKYKNENKR